MQTFANQQPPDIHTLFCQFLAQLPPAQIEHLAGKSNALQLTGKPSGLPDLRREQRTHVDTATAAHYLNRRPQTLRGWHCHGAFPTEGLRPLAINGRLAWNVTAIKSVMGVA